MASVKKNVSVMSMTLSRESAYHSTELTSTAAAAAPARALPVIRLATAKVSRHPPSPNRTGKSRAAASFCPKAAKDAAVSQ